MTDELKFPNASESDENGSLGEPFSSLIRDMYQPPVAAAGVEAYWAAMEQRISARVATDGSADGNWWIELAPWSRLGLIAAAAIFAVAGVVNRQIGEDSQFAYESVVETSTPASQELVSVQDGSSDADPAALRYYVSN